MSPEKKKRGLSAFLSPEQEKKKNRGMGAFVGSEETLPAKRAEATNKPSLGIIQAEINSIKPSRFQARKNIPPESIKELSDSIKTQGVIQPLIVRKLAKGYELVAGERRLRASKLAGLNSVPVLIREDSEESALTVGLIENLQREDLNPLEEAEGILRLQKEFGLTQQSMGEALGKSRSAIANSLRLLQLSKPIQKMLFDAFWGDVFSCLEPAWFNATNFSLSNAKARLIGSLCFFGWQGFFRTYKSAHTSIFFLFLLRRQKS